MRVEPRLVYLSSLLYDENKKRELKKQLKQTRLIEPQKLPVDHKTPGCNPTTSFFELSGVIGVLVGLKCASTGLACSTSMATPDRRGVVWRGGEKRMRALVLLHACGEKKSDRHPDGGMRNEYIPMASLVGSH
jgi:hypothetical protein